jgi:hypothetical protein
MSRLELGEICFCCRMSIRDAAAKEQDQCKGSPHHLDRTNVKGSFSEIVQLRVAAARFSTRQQSP